MRSTHHNTYDQDDIKDDEFAHPQHQYHQPPDAYPPQSFHNNTTYQLLPQPLHNNPSIPEKELQLMTMEPSKGVSLTIPNEDGFRKQLQILSIHSWYNDATPAVRRKLFANSKLELGRCPHEVLYDNIPRIYTGDLTYETWRVTVTGLLQTRHCDVLFTLGTTLYYFYRILQVIKRNSGTKIRIDNMEIDVNSPTAKNGFFIGCNLLATKYNDDYHLSNKYYAKQYKVSQRFINEMEIVAFRLLHFKLTIPCALMSQIMHDLAGCIEEKDQ